MQATISKRALVALLERVCPVASTKRAALPILSAVLLRAAEGALHASATDLVVSITTSEPCEVATEGAVAVDGKDILARVQTMPEGPLVLTVSERRLSIKAGASRREFGLHTLGADDFPKLPEPLLATTVSMSAKAFAGLVKRVGYAMSTDETRPHLNAALLEWNDGKLRMVATDGHRLAVAEELVEGQRPTMLVGLKAINELARLAATTEGNLLISEDDANTFASLEGTTTTLAFKRIDAAFPPYQQVIPKDAATVVELPRAALTDACRALQLTADAIARRVEMRFGDNTLALSASSTAGEGSDSLPIEYSGPARVIALNGLYLVAALAALGGDTVTLALGKDELDPLLLTPDGTKAVVMPMRV